MNYRLLLVISFAAVLVSDIVYYFSASMHISFDSTYIEVAMKFTSLVCLMLFTTKFKWSDKIPAWTVHFFRWLILWNMISLIIGAFTAADYWDWKNLFLSAIFTMMVPYAMVAGVLFIYSKDLFTLIVTRLFVLGYLIIPLTAKIDLERELYPRSVAISVCFFILIMPYLKTKWKLVISLAAATAIFLAYDFRTNVLRIAIATIVMTLYYIRNYIPNMLLKTVCVLLFLIPPVFLVLGLTGQYNVFKPSDDIEYVVSYGNGQSESNLAQDTRTFLYQEVLASMNSRNSFLFGEGANGKYKTEYFEDIMANPKAGRYGSEVGFLNMLLYCGIAGVSLYALMLFSAVYYGVSHSNNFLCKMLALFLALRWITFFIEDYMQYDINCYFLWIAIGLCLSNDFRALTDADIRQFFNFPKKSKRHVLSQKEEHGYSF